MVTIDGLNELTLKFLDVMQFDADLYKVTWSPDMTEGEHAMTLAEAVATIGAEVTGRTATPLATPPTLTEIFWFPFGSPVGTVNTT